MRLAGFGICSGCLAHFVVPGDPCKGYWRMFRWTVFMGNNFVPVGLPLYQSRLCALIRASDIPALEALGTFYLSRTFVGRDTSLVKRFQIRLLLGGGSLLRIVKDIRLGDH